MALFYNAINAYDIKLAAAYQNFRLNGCPSLEIRAAQAYLTYLGYDPKGVDGFAGQGTATALVAFRKACSPRIGWPALPTAKTAPAAAAAVDAHLQCLQTAFAATAA